MDERLPVSPDELTPEWLTDALRAGGSLKDGRVVSLSSTVVGDGIGFIGMVARIEPQYEGTAGPLSLIGKFPATDPGSRTVGNLYGLYEREVRFYNDIARDAGVETPGCYFAAYDAAAGQSLILLEELRGGDFGNQVGGCTIEEARLAIRSLAGFHSRWWQSPRLDELSWMTTGDQLVRNAMTVAYDACWEPCLQRWGHVLTTEMIAAGPGLGRRIIAELDIFASKPLTLLHGDYRLDNMFFGDSQSSRPLVVCDWQSPNRGWGPYDLAYFLAGSLDPEERRKYERDFAAEYHAILQERGIRDYSFHELWEDYRACLAVMMGIFVINGATLPTNNERGQAVFEKMIGRFVTAINDLDALSVLPS